MVRGGEAGGVLESSVLEELESLVAASGMVASLAWAGLGLVLRSCSRAARPTLRPQGKGGGHQLFHMEENAETED